MGEKDTKGNAGAVVPITLDANGKVQYDVLLRQGSGKDKIIHSTYNALVPVAITADDPKRELPDEDAVRKATEKTKQQFDEIVGTAQAAAAPTKIKKQQLDAKFIRYTSAQQGEALNSGAQQRVIRMVNVQNDPMEPPRFLTNKKIPRGPPSPPAPVLHSPTRKVTAEEQSEWKIPPCVSNWKNQKGHTIPLHIRLAADGQYFYFAPLPSDSLRAGSCSRLRAQSAQCSCMLTWGRSRHVDGYEHTK
jgi:SNW domain-containing protein 1